LIRELIQNEHFDKSILIETLTHVVSYQNISDTAFEEFDDSISFVDCRQEKFAEGYLISRENMSLCITFRHVNEHTLMHYFRAIIRETNDALRETKMCINA